MKKILIVLWSLCLFLSGTAQTVRLTEKNGNSTQIAMSNLRSVSFSAGNLLLNLKTGSPVSYEISNVQSLKFLPQTLDSKSMQQNTAFSLYPNPATDYITLDFSAKKSENVMVEIVNLQGSVFYRNLFGSASIISHSVNLSALQAGMYFCRFICANEVSTISFIKK